MVSLLSAPAHPPTPLSSHHYTAPSTRPRLAPLTVGGRADVVSAVIARVVGALSAVRERGGAGRRVRQRTQEAIEEEHLRPTVGNAFGSGPSACAHDKSLSFLTMVSLRKKRSAIFLRRLLRTLPSTAVHTAGPVWAGPRRGGGLSHAVHHRHGAGSQLSGLPAT